MSNKPRKRSAVALAFGTTIALGAGLAGAAAPGTAKGPSTTTDPYVIPIDATKVQITSLLTVDDPAPGAGYVVAGIPDGLGAFPDGSGGVTLISNHEIGGTSGAVRSHGFAGAFFSRHTINPSTLAVSGSADLIPAGASIDWSGVTPRAWSRFCSGDLSGPAQLFNTVSGNGYNGRLYFAGEESGLSGLAVGVDPLNGDAKVLTKLGQMSWENLAFANTATSDVVLGLANNDSSAANQNLNYFYVGTKTNTGTKWDKAGLTNGSIFGYAIAGTTTDAAFRTTYGKNNPATWTPTSAIVATTGAAIQSELATKNALQLDRTEDGAWDPSNPNDYYFVTTGTTAKTAQGGRGGLWKLSFVDRTNPSLGGTLTLLLDGTEGAGPDTAIYMPDNITIDSAGHILIQEDPGGDNYVARIWAYDIATKQLAPIATFDPALFAVTGTSPVTQWSRTANVVTVTTVGAPSFSVGDTITVGGTGANTSAAVVTATTATTVSYASTGANVAPTTVTGTIGKVGSTIDEESSGIIPAPSSFGPNTFLFDAQVHTAIGLSNPTSQVERGQYLLATVDFSKVFAVTPPAEIPEAPLSVLLPLTAAALGGAGVMIQRRRRTA